MNKLQVNIHGREALETIFGALENIESTLLLNYAKEMKEKAQDSIEWGIAESVMRFARFKNMAESAIEVGDNADDCELARELSDKGK